MIRLEGLSIVKKPKEQQRIDGEISVKSNDEIPEDEMLLAEAIAAAKAAGKGWTSGVPFEDACRRRSTPEDSCRVCALGALHLAGKVDLTERGQWPLGSMFSPVESLNFVINGNDTFTTWTEMRDDSGESLGWAFRCAMTQEAAP